MTKKVLLTILTLLIAFTFFLNPVEVEAKTLRDMYADLESLKKDMNEEAAKKKAAEQRISSINSEIKSATKDIEDCEKRIVESIAQIEELKKEIELKNKEIDDLLSFLQISDGENVYLEYVFGASSFTDFIYRSAIVEQLSKHNDELIDEMNGMIEKEKVLQKELAERKKEQERLIATLKSKLKSVNVDLAAITEEHHDLKAQVKAQEEVIKHYKDVLKCDMDEDISKCVDVPYANGMIRPTKKGSVTSNYGYRIHPISGQYKFHNGVDIGIAEGNPIYAAAAGRVAAVQVKASCGGNGVYVHHTISGKNYTTLYLHLQKINVKVGEIVTANTIVGYSGGGKSTPWDRCSTGGHLHFSLGKGWYLGSGYLSYSTWVNNTVNPRDYISIPSRWTTRY